MDNTNYQDPGLYGDQGDHGDNGLGDSQQEEADRLQAMSPEEREHQRREWAQELEKTEEEIQTLRQVLSSKIRHANDLKRKLGITVFGELRSSLQHWKESDTYQRTASAAKGAKERTSELTHSMANSFSQKWTESRAASRRRTSTRRCPRRQERMRRLEEEGEGDTAAATGPLLTAVFKFETQ
uniref:Tumor protein D54 n=1 Tax=Macrostomum lignano TaxID=282301 RepID=A0A1I8IPW3_9PLAT